jgi:hypothetical protein
VGWCCHSLRSYCTFRWTIELHPNSIRYFVYVPWSAHRQLQIQRNSISFRIVWYHVHSQILFRFWATVGFLFNLIRESLVFPGSYRSLMWIPISLTWLLVFLFDLASILSRSI